MGNKESHFNERTLEDGRDNNQALDSTLIRTFTEIANGDTDELNLEKFQIVRILTNIRQYRLLSGLYDRAVRLAGEKKLANPLEFGGTSNAGIDGRFFWHQLSLALICDHRFQRATKVLHNCISQAQADPGKLDENSISEYMLLVRIQIEQLGDIDLAESTALKAVDLSKGTWLSGRCYLLLAMVNGLKAHYSNCFESKKSWMADSIGNYEKVIELDPHDDLAHFYCALEYANSRNLDMARERCQTALDLNMENPFAIMLMALIFTARKDYKGALELVINALADFPSHYGLLVLRLKLEARYGRVEEALQTSRNLICFWRKSHTPPPADEENGDMGLGGKAAVEGLFSSGGRQVLGSKEAIVPLTPLLTAPLGIAATPSAHLAPQMPASCAADQPMPYPSNDNLSTVGPPGSELGGGGPPSTDSISMLSSSSRSWISYSAFRLQADIWVELAEFFIEMDRLQDVQACVEEACTLYPNSHQALYLKGFLYFTRAKKCSQTDPSLARRLRGEARNCVLGAISICTGHEPSHSCLGDLYHAEGNLKMAEKMYRDSMAIDPFHFLNWHKLGCVLAELGRNEEALECFQTAASLDTNSPLIPFHVIPRLLGGAGSNS